jgi:hypothetical protein
LQGGHLIGVSPAIGAIGQMDLQGGLLPGLELLAPQVQVGSDLLVSECIHR